MPSIYTFSLDNVKDAELIALLESKKNRSDYIRTILRQDMMLNVYMEAFDSLYHRYKVAMAVMLPDEIECLPKSHFLINNKYAKDLEEE